MHHIPSTTTTTKTVPRTPASLPAEVHRFTYNPDPVVYMHNAYPQTSNAFKIVASILRVESILNSNNNKILTASRCGVPRLCFYHYLAPPLCLSRKGSSSGEDNVEEDRGGLDRGRRCGGSSGMERRATAISWALFLNCAANCKSRSCRA